MKRILESGTWGDTDFMSRDPLFEKVIDSQGMVEFKAAYDGRMRNQFSTYKDLCKRPFLEFIGSLGGDR